MSQDVLLVEKHPDGYAVLTLNRPRSLNAWSMNLCTRFCEAFTALQEDDQVRVLILTGNGPAFCAGLDVKEMRADPDAYLSKDRPVDFICARGFRSLTAAKLAERLGDENVYNLEGGTSAWTKSGLSFVVESVSAAA